MIKVKLTPPRESFNGKLGGVIWRDGKATIPALSQKLVRGYGVVEDSDIVLAAEDVKEIVTEPEDTLHIIEPIEPDEVFVEDSGAKELADIVASKKATIEALAATKDADTEEAAPKSTLKKSDLKTEDDFKGVGSWGKYKKYVGDLTGVSPKNKEAAKDALAGFRATLED